MTELLQTLNGMSPLGVIALLGVVIYLLVNQRAKVTELGDNHLHEVTGLLKAALASLGRLETGQQAHEESTTVIREKLTHIAAKLNGAAK